MSENTSSRLRFAINLGNAVLAHLGETGEPAGLTVELSHRLATRWGVTAEFVPYPAAGKVVADAGGDHWDIAFLAIEVSGYFYFTARKRFLPKENYQVALLRAPPAMGLNG